MNAPNLSLHSYVKGAPPCTRALWQNKMTSPCRQNSTQVCDCMLCFCSLIPLTYALWVITNHQLHFVQPSSLKGFLVLFLWILLLFPLNCLKQTVDSILTHTAFSLGGSSSMALALCTVVTQWLAIER